MWVGISADAFAEKRFQNRMRFVSVLFAFCCGLIVLRLFYLQVILGDYLASKSESNRTNVIFLRAPRGNFYDRNGKLLVTNRPSWAVMYSFPGTENLTQENVVNRLKPFLHQFPDRWEKNIGVAFKNKQMVRLVEDIPKEAAFGMSEMGDLIPGVRMEMEFRRDYPPDLPVSQLIGYLSEISERELTDTRWNGRKPGDLIGKMGLERVLDGNLRGEDGGMLMEVDSVGRLKRVIRELPYRTGQSVRLTLDSDLQRTAQMALANTQSHRGAVVAIDLHTGAIRCWVSSPTFDPAGPLGKIIDDPNKPFLDRVYRGGYAPGSTFKVITAITGFEKGVINTSEKVNCVGFVTLPDKRGTIRTFKCWKKHGVVDFWRAVTESCDTYFYLLSEKVGSQAIYETAVKFGLGQPAQDLLTGEEPGLVPNPFWKHRTKRGGWSTGDTYNMAIGQGFLKVTPLQTALMMGRLATRGKALRLHITEDDMPAKSDLLRNKRSGPLPQVDLKPSTWDYMLRATKNVVDYGTGYAAHIPYLEVRGKTGTAQNPHGIDHAWFMAAAGYPGEEPALAVCVLVENGGNGSAAAAPIAKQIIELALPPRTPKDPI